MAVDIRPLVNQLTIVTKDLREIQLTNDNINRSQHKILDYTNECLTAGKPIRMIVLKARQMGLSTIIQAIMFTLLMNVTRYKAKVISHENESSKHLLSMQETYWETWPFNPLFKLKNNSQLLKAWDIPLRSAISISTAKNTEAGRSQTVQAIHASEIAFWDNAYELSKSLSQALPYLPLTLRAFESTANGVGGFFHEWWEASVDGEVEDKAFFFPWHEFPAYNSIAAGLGTHTLTKLDDEENALIKAFGLTKEQLIWRRWKIANDFKGDVQMFHQEYPSTADEAFISTGRNVFPLPLLRLVFDFWEGMKCSMWWEGSSVRMVPDITGDLIIYRPPDYTDWGKYVVAGDPSRTVYGDYACAQVINRRTWEQVAVFRKRCDPGTFAEELMKLGYLYNRAILVPEITGPGQTVIGHIMAKGYPNVWRYEWPDKHPGQLSNTYGWETNVKRKHEAIGNLLKQVVDRTITIHDEKTFLEMKNYVTLDNGGYGNGKDENHDDTVMSLAIAISVTMKEMSQLLPYSGQHVSQKNGGLFVVKQPGELKLEQSAPDIWTPEQHIVGGYGSGNFDGLGER